MRKKSRLFDLEKFRAPIRFFPRKIGFFDNSMNSSTQPSSPGESFNHFLRKTGVDKDLRSILYHLARAVKYINFSLRAGNTGLSGTQNIQGEEQMALDVLADRMVTEELRRSELVAQAISEEQEHPQALPHSRGSFVVAYDPLDGSSLVETNLAIGSIFGIWAGETLEGKTGAEMLGAAYAVYGPRIRLVVAIAGKGAHEFELNDVGEFIVTRSDIEVDPTAKYFAPGNLRASNENPHYQELVDHFITQALTLRYSGGMTPDVHHILTKGSGIFAYPSHSKYPQGKLRLAFECAPMAFIFQEASGLALAETGTPILEIPIESIHQRTTIFIGSRATVEQSVEQMNGEARAES